MGVKFGGFIPRHTEEEVSWAKDKIENRLRNVIKPTALRESGLLDEYNKLFHKNLSYSGFYTWLRGIQNPELKKKEYIKRKEQKLVFGARYLLYVNKETICGFETIEEVKEFLQNNLILSGQKLCLYEKKELGIKYDIEIK